MQSSSGQEIAARFPWRHRRRDAGDGGTDEPAKLIEMESVESKRRLRPRRTSRSKRSSTRQA